MNTGPRRIAIAGLGRMGQPIARRLRDAGAYLVLLAPRGAPLPDDLAALPQAGPAGLTKGADILITCLRDSDEVGALLGALIAAADRPILHIDHTSGDPRATRRHAALWQAAGHAQVDAALSGTPGHAAHGQLKVLAGGAPADLALAADVVRPYAGRGMIQAGGHGQGHALRLVAGMMGFGIAALSAEMLTHADRLGLDRDTVHAMITGSGADSSTFQAIHAVARDGATSSQTRQLPILAAVRDLATLAALLPGDGPSPVMLQATRALLQRADPDSDPTRMISGLYDRLSTARNPE